MKLRGRFTLWFCLTALIPIAAATVVTREILTRSYGEEAAESRSQAENQARRSLTELELGVVETIAQVATRNDPYVGGTLLDLDTHGGELPMWSRRRLEQTGAQLMRQLQLDLLFLLDDKGIVLDAPHFRPAEGEARPDLLERGKRSEGKATYVMQPVLDSEQIRKVLMVEAIGRVEEGGSSVTVAGARRVTAELLEAVRQLAQVQARIVAADGTPIVPARESWKEELPGFSLPLRDQSGAEIARLEVQVDDSRFHELRKQVSTVSALFAGLALVVTILLGLFVARRMTRDLDAVVAGAHAAATGDLDYQVEVKSKDEIGELADAFNTMMVDLQESKERLMQAERVAAWQEIARRLAHEIKNPLTPIQMSVETLRKVHAKKHPSFDDVFEQSTKTVLEEAGRLKRIVSEFSEFARMPKPKKSELDLNELVVSQTSLYEGSVELQRDLEEGLPLIDADKDTLSQLILNLLENARDALSQSERGNEGIIRVSTRSTRKGRAVALTIEDNGPGIAPDIKDKLFTPYFTTKHAHGGTGLGLAIAHRIISDHQGRISVDDSDLGGARFTIELPAQGSGDEALVASASMTMKRAR